MKRTDSFSEISDVSKKVFSFAEIGSKEFRTSRFLADFLKKKGFSVTIPYKGMKTSFRAEYGKGRPTVCFLCEEDALPNGHSCGHNLIAAWAVGSAVKLKEEGYKGKIVVVGTPSEEGIGEYAGSKEHLVETGAFRDIDFAMGFHPDSQWNVGCQSPEDMNFDVTFLGKASHMEEPDKGRNALDALVTAYMSIRNLVAATPKYKHVTVGMFIEEGGQASNIVPEKARMEVDLRSTDSRYFESVYGRIKKLIRSIGKAYSVGVSIKETTPRYKVYINADDIDRVLSKNLARIGIRAKKLYESRDSQIGATDEANVSRVVPTGHIDMKIVPQSVPGHSDAFRNAAGSKSSIVLLKKAIKATVDSCIDITSDKETIKKIYRLKAKLHGSR